MADPQPHSGTDGEAEGSQPSPPTRSSLPALGPLTTRKMTLPESLRNHAAQDPGATQRMKVPGPEVTRRMPKLSAPAARPSPEQANLTDQARQAFARKVVGGEPSPPPPDLSTARTIPVATSLGQRSSPRPSRPTEPRVGFLVSRWREMREHLPGNRVNADDLATFTRQMATMLGAGLPLHNCLDFYGRSVDSKLGKIINQVCDQVSGGRTLSSSLSVYPRVFSGVYIGLIAAGETTGIMLPIFEKLADLCERNQRLQKKVVATLTYPVLLFLFAITMVLGFLYFILPMVVPLFSSLQVELPWPTKILVWVSSVIKNPLVILAFFATPISLVLFFPLLKTYYVKHPAKLRSLSRFPLELPVIGKIMMRLISARLLFSLATMLDAGYPLSSCLDKIAAVAGNAEIKARILNARLMLVEGMTAAECLGMNDVFPNAAIQMILVGEETADLSGMVRRVACIYEDDIELALVDLASFLEPTIMVGMGVVVGFVVVAAMLPMATLITNL